MLKKKIFLLLCGDNAIETLKRCSTKEIIILTMFERSKKKSAIMYVHIKETIERGESKAQQNKNTFVEHRLQMHTHMKKTQFMHQLLLIKDAFSLPAKIYASKGLFHMCRKKIPSFISFTLLHARCDIFLN